MLSTEKVLFLQNYNHFDTARCTVYPYRSIRCFAIPTIILNVTQGCTKSKSYVNKAFIFSTVKMDKKLWSSIYV